MAVKFEFIFAQTSHSVAFVCTLVLVLVVSMFGKGDAESVTSGLFRGIVRTAHLGCFGAWFGAQVWVTFFAGITMYHYLPRHTFGYIQSKLFPKYFMLGLVLSTISLVTFIIDNPITSWGFEQKLQAAVQTVNMLAVLANALYITPHSTTTMFEKHKLEKEEQAGNGLGKIEDDKAVKLRQNKHYVALEKKFARLHGCAAVTNLVSLSAQAVSMWYLAGNLRHL